MNLLQRIRGRKGIQDSLKNIGWLGGDRFLRMFGAVVVGTAVARYLGPGQFGLLNYGLAIFALFNIVSNLGLELLVVRELALDDTQEPQILGTACVLKGLASVVTTLAAIVAAHLLEPHDSTLVTIVALLSFAAIAQAFDVIDYFFQARTQARYAVIPRNIVFVIGSIARIVAVYLRTELLVFAWIAAGEYLFADVGITISYFLFRRPRVGWRWSFPKAKQLLDEGWPILVSNLMFMIYFRSDQVLLGKFASQSVVGQYSAAIKISEIWYAIPLIICASVMPPILKSREANRDRYYARLQQLYDSMVFVSVVVAICTQFAGPFVVRVLYGKDYNMASGILAVHIWTAVFGFVGSVSGQQLVQEKLTVSAMQRTAFGAVINIGLNLLLIPRWGGIGSAFATLAAQSVAFYFADAIDPRTRHIFRMKTRAYTHFWNVPMRLMERRAE